MLQSETERLELVDPPCSREVGAKVELQSNSSAAT